MTSRLEAPPGRPERPSEPLVVIEPTRGWVPLRLRELWSYHELLYFFVWRSIKVRYKQTFLGAAWAVLQPFTIMVVFSVFFGRLAGMPSEGVPYPVFAYSGLIPWIYFASSLGEAGNSLLEHERLITKVYFPRLVVPAAPVIANVLDLAIAGLVLVGMMLAFGISPTPNVWTLPLFVLLAATTAFAASLWLSALNVQYRDVRHVIPLFVQIWFFLTPIVYPGSLVPEAWRPVYALNPMVGVVEGFRWALLGTGREPGMTLAASSATSVVLLIGGLFYFRRTERTFADVI